MQNVLASLASHVTTPLSSSGRPGLFSGVESATTSSKPGSVSKNDAVMLWGGFSAFHRDLSSMESTYGV